LRDQGIGREQGQSADDGLADQHAIEWILRGPPASGAEDLVVYKALAWRPQDQQDVERLLLLHASEIDLVRVRRVVAGLAEALDDPERPRPLEAIIGRASATRASNRKSR
jgi:hypothetical protein